MPVKVPCGKCIGCRLEYSRQWAVRCVHESQLHEENAFVTLTYSPEHLPEDHSIHKEELQKFFKRLRKRIGNGVFRYFACGEYGSQKQRPHYHAILFGYGFPDRQLWSVTARGDRTYRSPLLEQVWTKGNSLIGDVTFESCAYVARYVTKKWKGETSDEVNLQNALVDPETGEVHHIEPEFCLMSRKPGIGSGWLESFKPDTEKDFITLRGAKMAIPKYYDAQIEKAYPEEVEQRKRRRAAHFNEKENTYERLRVREKVKKAAIRSLKRDFEG